MPPPHQPPLFVRLTIWFAVLFFLAMYVSLGYAVFFAENDNIYNSKGVLSFGSYTLIGMFVTFTIGLFVIIGSYLRNIVSRRK